MAYLILRDGVVFKGEAFGAWPAQGVRAGEVVFNTSMSGYQEMVTDLSYAGQILVLTQPQIGNYGWHDEESEAERILLRGLVVRELCGGEGSLHADRSLADFCSRRGIWGLKGADTRALTRHIRRYGTLPGVLAMRAEEGLEYWGGNLSGRRQSGNCSDSGSFSGRFEGESTAGRHWVYRACIREAYEIPGPGELLAVLDFGAKRNILRELSRRGFRIKVFPAWTEAGEILDCHPAGLVLTNGPGDPGELPEIVKNIRVLLPRLPILGICLGHQLLALAAGGTTYKLPFGHRGANHPVQDVRTLRTTMTSQNHGYAVEEGSLKGTGFQAVLKNLNDGTVEGMEHRDYPIISVQYHPEGAPGPEENQAVFERFAELLSGRGHSPDAPLPAVQMA
ncbi:Carbamoyl-phosphate synthase (glutamine-hydrolysing) [Acididesulfobacillus acetoxydans]|uniref:Carbamoyl phosphate synthase small chain n=1 Tax=Acididesulfobacillus acetoxydans TaxID=1561005 RepID=A0A8S0Y056_9FIRM|nr:glutamine-hydrolyzing carbamoyl-phosphate synthase small subunit [Acididesulfobacillus acetoxydans]CAA7602847.1 Carbamoyl-phosphate synthase (glutamine-hydrolysing) [Acididesulfobacillus acetoxydans]CEJ05728.1 Carbamoyl-phosphate synthase small chain [Acididesulfobacillus acetoxydans]